MIRKSSRQATKIAEEEQFIRRQVPAVEAAFRTQVSLAQPRGLHRSLNAEDDPAHGWSDPSPDNPDQLDLLRAQ